MCQRPECGFSFIRFSFLYMLVWVHALFSSLSFCYHYQCTWLSGKICLRNDLLCVEWDVKPCSTQLNLRALWKMFVNRFLLRVILYTTLFHSCLTIDLCSIPNLCCVSVDDGDNLNRMQVCCVIKTWWHRDLLAMCVLTMVVWYICRGHSFPWKYSVNSPWHFIKLHGLPHKLVLILQ